MEYPLAAVHSSNMQPHHKSAVTRWLSGLSGGSALTMRARQHVMEAGHALRQGGESILVGGILGAMHVEMPNGLDIKGKAPLDAIIGVAGMVGGVAMAHEEVGRDMRNAGAAALSIFTFRKSFGILAARKRKAGGKVGGTFAGDLDFVSSNTDDGGSEMAGDIDPIVQAARYL